MLTAAGGSWPVRMWASWECRSAGVTVRGCAGGMELRRGDEAIVLAEKHAFFAPEVARNFESYVRALPREVRDGVSVADFAVDPNTLNVCRRCVQQGVAVENREGSLWLRKGQRAMVLSLHHFVYASDMAARFELYFSPLVPELRDGLEVLDYSVPGKLQTYRKSGLQFEMASFPEEDDAIEEYFRWYRPKAGDLVFDLGAHCGVSSYHFSKLVGPEGKVVCFEPDPMNFAILKRNIERHGLENVVAENLAVAGTAGEIGFSCEGTIGSKMADLLTRESAGETVMVKAITLQDAFERWGTPNFCKIDIEGAEIEVIASAAETLRVHGANLALDTSHLKGDGTPTAPDVETMLRSYGYDVTSEANPLLTTWARPATQ